VLGVAGDNEGYRECCCRFGTLCELVGANHKQLSGATHQRIVIGPPATPATTKGAAVTPKKKRTRAKPAKADKPA
jgi:hypothetical protein